MNFTEIANTRQSCRKYDPDRPVEEEKLAAVLAALDPPQAAKDAAIALAMMIAKIFFFIRISFLLTLWSIKITLFSHSLFCVRYILNAGSFDQPAGNRNFFIHAGLAVFDLFDQLSG